MLRLNDYLPYLINRIGPPIEDGFAEALDEAGVTLRMWRVLAVLYEYGEQSVGDLASLTSIRISTLSRMIDRMARMGLVSRGRDDADGRSVTVHMLARGREKVEMLIPRAVAYERTLVRSFSEAELVLFKRLLVKFHEGIADPETVPPAEQDRRLAG